jgi:hypothetical protein
LNVRKISSKNHIFVEGQNVRDQHEALWTEPCSQQPKILRPLTDKHPDTLLFTSD